MSARDLLDRAGFKPINKREMGCLRKGAVKITFVNSQK